MVVNFPFSGGNVALLTEFSIMTRIMINFNV